MLVEWTEDFDQYKKGEPFELVGPSLAEYLASGKVKPSKKSVETAALATGETADDPAAVKEGRIIPASLGVSAEDKSDLESEAQVIASEEKKEAAKKGKGKAE